MQKSEKPQLKEMFFLYTLNQFFLALERKQESPMLRCFSLTFNNSKIPLKKDVLKQFFQISKHPQLIDEFFSIHAKPKTLFALRPTQKVGLLRCFSLAFNSSNISLKKRRFETIFSNQQTTSTNRRTVFYTSYTKNSFCSKTHTKSGIPTLLFVSFR